MGRFLAGACSVCAGLVLASCGGSSVPVYSEGDETISAASGDRFRIEFEANPSVGDGWTLTGEPDPAVVRLEGDGFESDAPEDVAGAPGIEYFLFEAVGPGRTEIDIRYCYRGCGGEGADLERTASFEVTVSP